MARRFPPPWSVEEQDGPGRVGRGSSDQVRVIDANDYSAEHRDCRLPISSNYALPIEFVWTMWTTFHKSPQQQQKQARIFWRIF